MDKMGEGVVTLVIGMTIVFSVLIILWAILLGFKQIFYVIPNKKKEKAKLKIEETKNEVSNVAPVINNSTAEDDTELIAVITAAICSLTGQSASKFNIKSIKRISNWNK